ncbi:MAG: hypothetical protein R3B64_02885 [Candidatus Paceibacterota bacterium]
MQSETKQCQNCKTDFVIETEDFLFYEKVDVPPPTFCPECRMIRRLCWRNERFLFRREDAKNGGELFSGFPPEAVLKTYENKDWFGDGWNPLDYGKDIDFSSNFLSQFKKLFETVPLPAKSSAGFMINSDYCNEAGRLKNAYLCFDSDFVEDSGYTVRVDNIKNCFDIHEATESEVCYEGVMLKKGYKNFFSMDCENSVDVWFSKGLRGCTNCFGCVNLKGKSHHWFNEPLSKEEYAQKIAEFDSGSYDAVSKMQERAFDFWKKFPVRYYHGLRNVDCTGERIYDSKNVKDSVSVQQGENIRYTQIVSLKGANSYDSSILFMGAENSYEALTCGEDCYGVKFSFNCWSGSRDLEYCGYCVGSSDCFGCVGLSKKQYCILNKQYSKEEYEVLVPKIKKLMNEIPYIDSHNRKYTYGEFFPFEFSPIAYNESLANDYIPKVKEDVLSIGLAWRDPKDKEFKVSCAAADLSDNIADADEGVLKEIISCQDCKKAYRVIASELTFYKQNKLPLPRFCHNCRFEKRFELLNKPGLYNRSCGCVAGNHGHDGLCGVDFQTPYSPDSPFDVYCESCYQKEII